MNQKLSNWASLAEMVSGVAVVVTLIVLVLGVRENTQSTQAQTFADALESVNVWGRTIFADPELTRIVGAFFSQRTDELDGQDMARLGLTVTTLFLTYDGVYSMRRRGIFGDSEWARFERVTCDNFQLAVAAGISRAVLSRATTEFSEFLRSSCSD